MKPAKQTLRRYFFYRPSTGELRWKSDAPLPLNLCWRRNKIAGYVRPDGYLSVGFQGKRYMVHRLIWVMMTGNWPKQLDHKDLNKLNNRWENLREANKSQNGVNCNAPKSNSLGYKGIARSDTKIERWLAFIRIKGRKVNLGSFKTKKQAALAYNYAAKKYYGEFARLNKLVLAIFILCWMWTPALAIECRERPGGGKSYWTYRLVEGQRCWYPGHRRLPKSSLHWPDDEPKPKRIKSDPVFNAIRAEDESVELGAVTWHMRRPWNETHPIYPPLLYNPNDVPEPECCWPDLSEFDRRFVGVQP